MCYMKQKTKKDKIDKLVEKVFKTSDEIWLDSCNYSCVMEADFPKQ